VHVLVCSLLKGLRVPRRVLKHVLKRREERAELAGRDDACTRDRTRPRCASLDVLAHEPTVEWKRVVEAAEEGVALRG
jgi:hypothetical protein